MAIEFAESGALLRERGIDFELSEPHPLAPLRPCRRNEIPGVQKADVVSEDEVTSARKEAVARLSTFTGRTKKINGRPYFHLDDYQAWSERKAGDDLEVTEGVVTASWNAWVETSGNDPQLAGISVSKLDPGLKEEDYFVCKNPERGRRREERASLTRTLSLPRSCRHSGKQPFASAVVVRIHRGTIAERGMAPATVVKDFEVVEDFAAGRARVLHGLVNQFKLERGKEALRHRVVPAFAVPAHAAAQPMPREQLLVFAPARIGDHDRNGESGRRGGWRCARAIRSASSASFVEPFAHRPAHHPA